jgi:hypothetical protein
MFDTKGFRSKYHMWRKGRSGRCGIKGVAAKLSSRYRRFSMNYDFFFWSAPALSYI